MKVQCLLIEDDLDDQELFCMAIQEIDPEIECFFANNGIDGIEKINSPSFVPDYIFIDLNMPRMNGVDCLKEVKKCPVSMICAPHIVNFFLCHLLSHPEKDTII